MHSPLLSKDTAKLIQGLFSKWMLLFQNNPPSSKTQSTLIQVTYEETD